MKTITLQIDHNKYSEKIEIKDTQTLADLAIKILATYCYSNNHSHAFFLDNTYWGIEDCIFSDGLDEEHYLISRFQRSTHDIKIKEIHFIPNVEFKFIFDFAEEKRFQCKVIDVK